MKWSVSLSRFDPFGLIRFGEPRRATKLSHCIPIQANRALNQKLAVWLPEVKLLDASAFALWAAQCKSSTVCPGYLYAVVEPFWLHVPLRNFHRNKRGPVFDAVSWGLIYKLCILTKWGLKEAHITSLAKVVMYKNSIDRGNFDTGLRTFWIQEISDANGEVEAWL